MVIECRKHSSINPSADLQTSRAYCQRQVDALWDEVKRFENPHNYYVDLSQKLWDIKQGLLNSHEMK